MPLGLRNAFGFLFDCCGARSSNPDNPWPSFDHRVGNHLWSPCSVHTGFAFNKCGSNELQAGGMTA
jgi:hypothetical protein